mgnify:CR=1 FL=1
MFILDLDFIFLFFYIPFARFRWFEGYYKMTYNSQFVQKYINSQFVPIIEKICIEYS